MQSNFNEVNEITKDSSQEFDDVIRQVEDNIKKLPKHKKRVPLDYREFEQFKKGWFYHNWYHRFRRLGQVGVISIPNTTLEDWIYWIYEWSIKMTDDYNQFKKLVWEAIKLHEEHLKILDSRVDDLEARVEEIERQIVLIWKKIEDITNEINNIHNDINNINNNITNINERLDDLEQQFGSFKANIFGVSYDHSKSGQLSNGWYMKDDPDKKFSIEWGWNNEQDHSQGIHWIPLINYIYKDNVNPWTDLQSFSELGTFITPDEWRNEGYYLGDVWIYTGLSAQSNDLVTSPFIKLEYQTDGSHKVLFVNYPRTGDPGTNVGTIQLNTGGMPTQYLTK